MTEHIKRAVTKITIPELVSMYNRQEKITAVTAYDFTMAKLFDQSGVDLILVGDSLGMVVQGNDTTLPVEMEHMLYHTRCVAKAVSRAHLMADMPFLSYQANYDDAIKNAGNLLKAGAHSVKIEGGEEMAELVWYLATVGIPVMGHIGLKPQSVHAMGGYKVQGKTKVEADTIFNDAQALEEAGAWGILLEGVPDEVAAEVTRTVSIPTIGIGSGPSCSGQILVSYDMLGANPNFKPRFVRQYANLSETVQNATKTYIEDVKKARFPGHEETVHRTLVEVKIQNS